ncbi:MAG: Uncharacterized protein LiPW15_649 [Parcubacteria group bacterium LiPW_15]|nr:MAG: Uncharacterized protein LiPW15_649 [Parcubacteria group bacterium LiPW_15]
MKNKLWAVGIAEAAGVALYIALFAFLVEKISLFAKGFAPTPMTSMVLFLLAFSVSALICGLIVFGYPYLLLMENKKREAVKIILWTAGSLAIILLIYVFVLVGV